MYISDFDGPLYAKIDVAREMSDLAKTYLERVSSLKSADTADKAEANEMLSQIEDALHIGNTYVVSVPVEVKSAGRLTVDIDWDVEQTAESLVEVCVYARWVVRAKELCDKYFD